MTIKYVFVITCQTQTAQANLQAVICALGPNPDLLQRTRAGVTARMRPLRFRVMKVQINVPAASPVAAWALQGLSVTGVRGLGGLWGAEEHV